MATSTSTSGLCQDIAQAVVAALSAAVPGPSSPSSENGIYCHMLANSTSSSGAASSSSWRRASMDEQSPAQLAAAPASFWRRGSMDQQAPAQLAAAAASSWRRGSMDQQPLAAPASSWRRGSMDQQPPAQLLAPKPAYSSIPEHEGKKLLLVVDGDPRTQHTVLALLECQPDFIMVSVQNGEEALLQLRQMPYLPSAVLLAKELPGTKGRQVCKILRTSYSAVELPIIMLLPKHTPHSATEACMEAGANDCIIKPIGQAELLARLSTHIMLPQLAAAEADRHSNYRLLEAMLPPRIIERLKTGSKVIAEQHEQVTILFSDIVSFTTMSHELPTEFIINMLEELFSAFDECCDKHNVYKVETIGDAYMCVAGHEGHCEDHALRVVEMAESMLQATERVGKIIGHDLQIRIGIHTGPAYSGVVGRKCPRYCFFGDTVNTASRMESSSFPMCVHFSQATKASLDRAWMLRSVRNSGGGADDGADDREVAPESVCLGARYQKGKGLVTSHLLKVGAYREAVKQLGLPDPDSSDSGVSPDRDMHSALMQASAAVAVVAKLQNEARKALGSDAMIAGMRRSTLDIEGAFDIKAWRVRPSIS